MMHQGLKRKLLNIMRKLHGKELLIATSTGSPAEAYQAGGKNHYAMSELLKPFQATSNLIGTTFLPAFIEHGGRLSQERFEAIITTILDVSYNQDINTIIVDFSGIRDKDMGDTDVFGMNMARVSAAPATY